MPAGQETLQRPLMAYLHSCPTAPASYSLDDLALPSPKICIDALSFAYERLPPWAVHHSVRTYLWAIAFARLLGWDEGPKSISLGFDREELFLASVLHELGFQEECLKSRLSLEFWGALEARDWILSRRNSIGTPQRLANLADEAFEAIAMHSLELRLDVGPIRVTPALLSLGAEQDLLGTYAEFLHRGTVSSVCDRWPRLGYIDGLAVAAAREIAAKPGCLFEGIGFLETNMADVHCFRGKEGSLEESDAWRVANTVPSTSTSNNRSTHSTKEDNNVLSGLDVMKREA
jgi:cyanamide hydratase family protein with HD domain